MCFPSWALGSSRCAQLTLHLATQFATDPPPLTTTPQGGSAQVHVYVYAYTGHINCVHSCELRRVRIRRKSSQADAKPEPLVCNSLGTLPSRIQQRKHAINVLVAPVSFCHHFPVRMRAETLAAGKQHFRLVRFHVLYLHLLPQSNNYSHVLYALRGERFRFWYLKRSRAVP